MTATEQDILHAHRPEIVILNGHDASELPQVHVFGHVGGIIDWCHRGIRCLEFGEDLGAEGVDPPLPGGDGERRGQQTPQAPALSVVDHRDRCLGHRRQVVQAHEPRDSEARLCLEVRRLARRDEGNVILAVDAREVVKRLVGQVRDATEEPAVPRTGREAVESAA